MTDRRMVCPYTLTAKLAQFPYKFYYNNSPPFKWYCWSLLLCIPVFYKIQQLSCSEAGYIKKKEYMKKEYLEHLKHLEHLL